jgi:hypothetical protein
MKKLTKMVKKQACNKKGEGSFYCPSPDYRRNISPAY